MSISIVPSVIQLMGPLDDVEMRSDLTPSILRLERIEGAIKSSSSSSLRKNMEGVVAQAPCVDADL